jgi:RNA polymerase-binding transcription factor DksA
MNEEKIQEFKNKLEAEKEKLEAELSTVGRINPDNPNDWEAVPQDTNRDTDPNDRADNMEEYENNTAILKELETQLIDVKDALEKIEKGTYGKCEVDGEDIEIERLEANPAARTRKANMK